MDRRMILSLCSESPCDESIIVVLKLMDEQIHDSDYLIQTYDIPILAVIPDLLSTKSTNDYYQSAEQRMKKAR